MRKILLFIFFLCLPLALSAVYFGNGNSPVTAYYGVINATSPMPDWNLTNFPGGVVYVGRIGTGQNDLDIATGGTLNIGPGITVKFCTTSSDLRTTGLGVLKANGSSAGNIIFTRDAQANWGHISLIGTGVSQLSYCTIEWGRKTGINEEGYGGGLHINNSNVTVSNLTLLNNYSLWGGGIMVEAGNPVINDCLIYSNTSSNGGGGVEIDPGSSPTFRNCIIRNNTSTGSGYGGGGLLIWQSGAAKFSNCTIANNTTPGKGLNVYFYGANGASLINTFAWSNENCVFFQGTYQTSNLINCAIQRVYNNAGTIPVTFFTNCYDLGTTNTAADGPNFIDPAGSDYSIRFVSPGRDAGTSTNAPSTDILGNGRIGNYDIGAYEVQYSNWTGTTNTSWSTATNWEAGVDPASGSGDVIIPLIAGASPNYPVDPGNPAFSIGSVKQMILRPGAQVTLGSLTNSGTLRLESDASGISALICSSYSGNDAEVQLFLKGGAGTYGPNWHYISSPFNSLSTSVFSSVTLDLARWVESLASANLLIGWVAYDGYVYRVDPTSGPNTGPVFSNLTPGKGYNHYYALNHLYALQGQLNTSNAVSNLDYTVITPDAPTRYGLNLLGNPFSSGLDWDQIANDPDYPANTSKAIYFNNSGTIVYYINGVGSAPGVTGIIPPMQGFFTKTYSAGNSITLAASARVNGSIPARYKGASVVPLIRINLTSGNYADNTVVRFDNAAKLGQDLDFDAPKLFINNTYPYIYSVSEGTKFAINGLPFPDTLTEIPIVVNITSEGNHSLSAIEFQGLDNYKVTLTDKVTGVGANLKTTRYLPFTASPGLLADRFTLKIENSSTGIEDPVSSTGFFNIYPSSGYINIQTIADEWDGKSGSIRVLDLTGKVMSNSDNNYFSKNSMISFPARLPAGIYMVEIRTGTKRFVGKVMVK